MGRFPKLGTLFNRDFRNSYNQGVDKIDTELDAQVKRVDNLIANAPQPSEVVDARGGEAVLGNRLNNFDSQLAETTEELTQKANQLEMVSSLEMKRDKSVKIELEDASETFLGAMSGNASFNLLSIPQDASVTRTKPDAELITELDISIEDNISKVFEIHNKSFFHSGNSLPTYNKYFGAIKEITLIGFDSSKQHRLRLIARNHTTFKHRFILCSRVDNSSVWSDVFDSTSNFTVLENLNGLTDIECTIGSKTVKMKIDYTQFNNGVSFNDGGLLASDGRYRLNQSCFYENKIGKVKNDISQLKSDITNLNPTSPKTIYTTKNGTSFKIKFRHSDNENRVIEFNELGINKIIHPKFIYKETANNLTSDFSSPVLWYTLGTDWISPYSNVEAVSGTTSFVGTVGGNHGTSGSGGFPTARNVSAKMYANGKEVNDGEVFNTDKVVLVVTNMISASNHINTTTGEKADSLEETVTYVITPNNIEVSVYLTALEDLTIHNYVGLQMTTDMFVGEVYFNDSANKYAPNGIAQQSLPLPFDGDRVVYGNDSEVIVTYTNRETGLGNLSYKGTAPIYTLSTLNKIYAHLLSNSVSIQANEAVYYSGGYTISVPLNCVGAEQAYFIKVNSETIYCVDFLSPISNTYLELSEEIGKQIQIIEKSDTITTDNLISGKGLRISATSFGTLKFKIKS